MGQAEYASSDVDSLGVVGLEPPRKEIDLRDGSLPRRDAESSTLLVYRVIGLKLALADALCLLSALSLSYLIDFGFHPVPSEYVVGALVALIPWAFVFHAFGLYSPQHLSGAEEFRRIGSGVGIGVVALIVLSAGFDLDLSVGLVVLVLAIVLCLELASRRLFRVYVDRLQSQGTLALRTLLIGDPHETSVVAGDISSGKSGFLPVAFLDAAMPPVRRDALARAEQVQILQEVIRQSDVECIFVASPGIGREEMTGVLQAARREGIEVRVHTHLSGLLTSRLTLQQVGHGDVAITLRPLKLRALQRVVKRSFDLVFAATGLLVASPLILVIGTVIKLTSPGPVLFRQERVTEDGRLFYVLKFRTMRRDADEIELDADLDASRPFFKLQDDPRLTGVGKRLRRLSVDELPQLINVLKGEMSLVGPRPLPADQVAANEEILALRHEVRAGVTGWWQVNGRSDVEPEEAMRMDSFYIENWSLLLDLYILLRTVGVLLARKGAY